MVLDLLLTMPISTIFIMLVSVVMALTSASLQRKFTDPDKMREFRAKSSELRKQLSETRKKGDRKAYAKLMKQQQQLMRESSSIMGQQYKVLFIPMILFLVIYWALNSFYSPGGAAVIVAYAPFPLPWGALGADQMSMGFYLWYILGSLALNMPIYRVFRVGMMS